MCAHGSGPESLMLGQELNILTFGEEQQAKKKRVSRMAVLDVQMADD